MIYNSITNNKKIFIVSIFLSVLAIKLNPFLWIGVILLIFLIAFQIYPTKNIILFFILDLLVVSSDISETLRIVLNTSALIFFIYIFIKNYGLQINLYPKLPTVIKGYISFTILIMVLSSLFSDNIQTGLNETLRQIIFFVLWYILFTNLKEESDAYNYSYILVAAGSIVAIIILYSFINSDISIYLLQTQGIIHEGGNFKNVTAAGGIFAVTIPLSLVLLLLNYNDNKNLTYFFYAILFIQILGLFLTNSRSGLLAVFISSSIILFILKKETFKKFVLSVTISLIFFYFILPSVSGLFAIYFRIDRVFENIRYYLWSMSGRIIADNPIWGTGPGQFKNYMYNYIPVMLGSWEESQITWIYKNAGLGESHNFFLFRTAELGFGGLISAILLPVIFIYLCYKVMKQNFHSRKSYYLVVGIFSLGIGMLIRSFFESTGLLSHGWITRDLPFWICFAVIIHFYVIRTEIIHKT